MITTLLKMVLNKNNFNFNNAHYLQVGGTAMGTCLAPSYANIFMDYFERTLVYTYDTQPLLWKRCIDENFVIQSKKLALSFHKANYPDNVIQTSFDRAFDINRETSKEKHLTTIRTKMTPNYS